MSKNKISVLAISGMLLSAASFYSPSSHSALLVLGAVHGAPIGALRLYTEGWKAAVDGEPQILPLVIGCTAILPLCLLAENGETKSGEIGPSILKENGYSDQEVETILGDQLKVLSALAEKGSALQLEASETVESLRQVLQTLVPEISDAYLQFIVEYGGSH